MKNEIIVYYEEFVAAANELADKDIELHPLRKRETKRDRMERHLLGMLEMYQVRYGDIDQRQQIVDFLEKQLFRVPPTENEVCHLAYNIWKDLKKTILSSEYRPTEEAKGETGS